MLSEIYLKEEESNLYHISIKVNLISVFVYCMYIFFLLFFFFIHVAMALTSYLMT